MGPEFRQNLEHFFLTKNAQKLYFRLIGNVETRKHIRACVACGSLAHSGDALGEMFMLILFPTNAVAVFQIYLKMAVRDGATVRTRSWLKLVGLNNFVWTRFFGPTFNWYTWDRLNLLNLLQQTWPRRLAGQCCLGGTSTNLMSQEGNAFVIKLSGMDLLCVLHYFFFPSSTVYLHSKRCELG